MDSHGECLADQSLALEHSLKFMRHRENVKLTHRHLHFLRLARRHSGSGAGERVLLGDQPGLSALLRQLPSALFGLRFGDRRKPRCFRRFPRAFLPPIVDVQLPPRRRGGVFGFCLTPSASAASSRNFFQASTFCFGGFCFGSRLLLCKLCLGLSTFRFFFSSFAFASASSAAFFSETALLNLLLLRKMVGSFVRSLASLVRFSL